MMDDFKPSGKHGTSLSQKLDQRNRKQQPAEPTETPDPEPTKAEVDFSINEDDIDKAIEGKDVPDLEDKKAGKLAVLKQKLNLQWPPTKKQWAIYVCLLLVIALLVILLLPNSSKPVSKTASSIQKITAIPKSDLVASTLSGLPVSPSLNKQPVTGVMIENSDQARPQSGLSQAGVVFEAIAEGGITRFLALYQDQAPSNVGPVRSARPYFVQWDLGFDGSLAHVGGSPDALNDITAWNVKDLNEFYNGSSYHRISSRAAPHNVYTSISDLQSLESKKGFTSTNFSGFPRKAATPAKVPQASKIHLTLSGPDYDVDYAYNASSNSYDRSEGGTAMMDANTNTQLSPKVVIAIVVPLSQGALDASGAYYSDYNVIGSGKAYIFQDGNVTVGEWSKQSNTSQISFTDSNGQVVKLDAGQTWITALSQSSQVTYSP